MTRLLRRLRYLLERDRREREIDDEPRFHQATAHRVPSRFVTDSHATDFYEPRCSRRNASVRGHASSVARRLAASPSWAFRNTVAPS